jgi:aspartate/methionine/tyrosine aminotransferase
LSAIQEWATENKIWVISDEVYRTLYAGSPAPSLADGFPDAFVVGGLSKSISMTGFRLGWVVAPPSCVNAICQIHRLTVTCAPRLSQLLALEVLAQPHHLLAPAQIYEQRRRQIVDKCTELNLPMVCPEGAFYLWLDVRDKTHHTLEFCQKLHEKTSVLCIPGEAFGAAGQGFIRLSYAVELDVFFEGLERICHFLKSEEKNYESP